MNTAVEMVDKLRDTTQSHDRCSVVEVMGRNAGYIALNVGIACGAVATLIPERPYDLERDILNRMKFTQKTGKKHFIVIVAEGVGHAQDIANEIQAATGIDSRATVLGHVQRGGSPTLRTASPLPPWATTLWPCWSAASTTALWLSPPTKSSTLTSTWPCPCTRPSTPSCWMCPIPSPSEKQSWIPVPSLVAERGFFIVFCPFFTFCGELYSKGGDRTAAPRKRRQYPMATTMRQAIACVRNVLDRKATTIALMRTKTSLRWGSI